MKAKYIKTIVITLVIAFSLSSYIYLNYTIANESVTDQALEIINKEGSEASIFADLGILKGIISKVVDFITLSS